MVFDILSGVMAPKDQDSLTTTNHSVLERTFAVNTYGPLLLTQTLLSNILRSPSPKIGNMVSSTTLEVFSVSLTCAVFPGWFNSRQQHRRILCLSILQGSIEQHQQEHGHGSEGERCDSNHYASWIR